MGVLELQEQSRLLIEAGVGVRNGRQAFGEPAWERGGEWDAG